MPNSRTGMTSDLLAKARCVDGSDKKAPAPPVTMDFEYCVNHVLKWEGADGKVDRDPSDPGGTTKYGIDQRAHPGIDVAGLSKDQAKAIYYNEKWKRFRCDQLKAPWNLCVFDMAVNPGEGWVIGALQKAVNEHVEEDLTVDGFIGPKTISAVNYAPRAAIQTLLKRRMAYYNSLPETKVIGGKRRPFKSRFLPGWTNRSKDLEKVVNQYLDSVPT